MARFDLKALDKLVMERLQPKTAPQEIAPGVLDSLLRRVGKNKPVGG